VTLFWQAFRTQRTGLVVWSAIAALFTYVLGEAAPAAANPALLAKLPASIKAMMGAVEGLSALDVYVALKPGALIILLLPVYAVLMALSVVTREVDRRTIDFLLSLPVSRAQVLLARVGVLVLNTGLLALVTWLGLCASLAWAGLPVAWDRYGWMVLGAWLLALAWAGSALCVSLWMDDYSLAVKLWMGLVSGAYVLELGLRTAGISRSGRLLSPFSYADPAQVLKAGALPLGEAALLLLVFLAGTSLALYQFKRKQIAV
jgi:ABC-type transport system involved in multi-copper enzyme maturation permease subunit